MNHGSLKMALVPPSVFGPARMNSKIFHATAVFGAKGREGEREEGNHTQCRSVARLACQQQISQNAPSPLSPPSLARFEWRLESGQSHALVLSLILLTVVARNEAPTLLAWIAYPDYLLCKPQDCSERNRNRKWALSTAVRLRTL